MPFLSRSKEEADKPETFSEKLYDWFKDIAIALVMALIIRALLFRPSGSHRAL